MAASRLADRLIHMPRAGKRALALAVDMVLCAVTVWLAWCLRVEHWVWPDAHHALAAAVSCALALPLFARFGLYASIFRFAGWNATQAMLTAVGWYGALYALIFTVVGVPGVPRSIGVIQPLLLFMGVGASRLAVRLYLGDLYRNLLKGRHLPGVVVYGAGAAGRQLAAGLLAERSKRLVAYLDDDPQLQGRRLDGVPVHAPGELGELLTRYKVTDVLLAMPSASRQRRQEVLESLRTHPVHVRTLPGLSELVNRRISLADVHELDIEDLLGRDPVAPDAALMDRNVRGLTVMVTGAGGSIGRELCRQIVAREPQRLLLVEHSEYALYTLEQELRRMVPVQEGRVELVPLLASVRDEARMAEVMGGWRPDTVYHAAALKHVPLVEHNSFEGLSSNVWGTWVTARTAAAFQVANFVLVSTDKAVRPTNVMGASKRLAEMVLQAMAHARQGRTCFTMVRFGNVLGSSGSVVPLFRQQIAQGGPVTLTHAEMTRYFMTIPEAAQLVIQAGAMAQGGDVFVLDMGDPVRIEDLARRMVELSGLRVKDAAQPYGDIEIAVTGLRPGEKLYEELLIGDEAQPTTHPRILKASEVFVPWTALEPELRALQRLMQAGDHQGVREWLQRVVLGYQPQSPLVDWVYSASAAKHQAAQDLKAGLKLPATRDVVTGRANGAGVPNAAVA